MVEQLSPSESLKYHARKDLLSLWLAMLNGLNLSFIDDFLKLNHIRMTLDKWDPLSIVQDYRLLLLNRRVVHEMDFHCKGVALTQFICILAIIKASAEID